MPLQIISQIRLVMTKFTYNLSAPCISFDNEIKVPFKYEPIIEDHIIERRYEIKNNTSSQFEQMLIITLKQIIPYVLKSLKCLINQSLFQGIFPTSQKKAFVIPLYKVIEIKLLTLIPALSRLIKKRGIQDNKLPLIQLHLMQLPTWISEKEVNWLTTLVNLTNFLFENLDQGKYVTCLF